MAGPTTKPQSRIRTAGSELAVSQRQYDAQDRDRELHRIDAVTGGVIVASVAATVVLGAAVAWGDTKRNDQKAAVEQAIADASQAAAPITGPATKPSKPAAEPTRTQQPAAPTPTKTSKPKSKSGGS